MIFTINSALEFLIQEGERIRRANMLMCGATDPEASLKFRIDAAQRALDQWAAGSFQHQNLLSQVPSLVQFLKVSA